jgi:uncharacterized protein YjbI with pentapeptide repeats
MGAPETDYYAILQVAHTASEADIRSAYRRLAREHHPDANPSPEAEQSMRRINQAWETLRDPEKRSIYDSQRPRRARPPARPMRAQPPPRPRPRQRPQEQGFPPEDSAREAPRASAEYTGDLSINWYREVGVREDAPRQEIVKALSKMAAGLSGADISATEFARRRNTMREAWAVLGDQYMRAAYDRARKKSPNVPAPPEPGAASPPGSSPTPPPGYRLGPVTVNGHTVDKAASLAGVDLRGADLRGLDLAGIDLRDARLQGADLEAASLRRARLQGADLSGSNLRFADLSHADATAASLRQADLASAALHATVFFRAVLSGASLAGSVGPGINLDYADLARTDFTGAKITPQLIERGNLAGTIMPDGTTTS